MIIVTFGPQDNVCFALSSCELVTQRCEQCSSGKKVEIPLIALVVMLDFLRTKIQSAGSKPGERPNRSLKLREKDVENCKMFYILN